MTIEIIQRGMLPADKVYKSTCRECHSTLQFKRGDARYVSDQRDGDALVVKCPVCKQEIWVTP